MTRGEAWEEFRQKHEEEIEEVKTKFCTGLEAGADELMERILTVFGEIAKQAEEQEKYGCVHFLFSMLRYEMTKGRALVRLDVMNAGWMLDEEPLYTELDVTFLFQPYFEWKEKLLLDMREYMGKVNKYDVEYLLQEEILQCTQIITHVLRFLFRDIESQENFAKIPKLAFWNIRLGEYRDYSEIIMQVNREPRSSEEWLDQLEGAKENPELMNAGWWYRCTFEEGECSGKQMYFTVFEECTLKGIDFSEAQMTGARFLNCRLEGCSFAGTNLEQAEFEQCEFIECSFACANLNLAVFSPEGLNEAWFDEKQKEEMLVALAAEEEGGEG